MKKKTIFGVSALAGLLLLSAGCTESKTPVDPGTQDPGTQNPGTQVQDKVDLGGETMNVYVSYCAQTGATFTGKMSGFTTYTNPVDGITYLAGNLLPMWKEVETKLNCKIHDSVWDFEKDKYTVKKTQDQWKNVLKEDANFSKIDFLMTDSASAAEMMKNDKLVNLYDYLEYMPNFAKFLDEHPSVESEMTNLDDELYMLPYFDGLDSVEKMILMNTEVVEALLDNDAAVYDTTSAKATVYQPTIDTSKDMLVKISVNGVAEDLTIKASENPITRQNSLQTQNGRTFVEALKAHIDTAYMTSGKYTKRSQVFTGESACYTTDDLIALMRCAVNNPGLLGVQSVQGIVPRETKDSRIDSILYFTQIWGVRGVVSEKEYLYFGKDGKLKDARTTAATYDALDKLHQLYQEGLIINGFEDGDAGTKYNAEYLTGKSGATLLMYDYNATQAVYNQVDENGIGTASSKYNGVMPVLPPLTKWEDDTITDSKYALSRYTEDTRTNKGAGTVIPVKDDEEQIIRACQLADFFYSPEGANLQDYGPAGYTEGTIDIGGQVVPKYTSTIMKAINDSGLGWNNYFRTCVGTTQGIGHVRSDGVDYQVTHMSGRKGLQNILTAVKSGAVICATTTRANGFGATVPSQWSSSPTVTDTYVTLTDFWKRGTGKSGWRQVVIDGWDVATKTALEALWATANNDYLNHYQSLLNLK